MFLGIIVQLLWCLYVFTVTYLLLLFFLIYLFVTAKAALPKIALKKLPGLGSETSKSINKLIGSTKWLWKTDLTILSFIEFIGRQVLRGITTPSSFSTYRHTYTALEWSAARCLGSSVNQPKRILLWKPSLSFYMKFIKKLATLQI